MITTIGKAYEQRDGVYIKTTRPGVANLSDEVTVQWHDKRLRSDEQNKLAWKLMTFIGDHQGMTKYEVYEQQRFEFSAVLGQDFHLSRATMRDASTFINILVGVVIKEGVQMPMPLYEFCDDITYAVYVSMYYKKCCVCGRKNADLHHVDAVGMGYNRDTKPQIGNRVLPLCREHHMEFHNIGVTAFNTKYHLEPVRLDERLAKVYGLTKKARQSA
jgi:hypothetical protein